MPRHLTTQDLVSTTVVLPSEIGAANGVAGLDASGLVPIGQLPIIAAGSVTSVNGQIGNVIITAGSLSAVAASQVGVSNGVASLDNTGRVPVGQMPTGTLVNGQIGVSNGVAGLDSAAHVPVAQLPVNIVNGIPQLDGTGVVGAAQSRVSSVNGNVGAVSLTAASVSALSTATRGAINGVAALDGFGRVPLGQMPDLSATYLPAPATAATAAGQLYTAVAPGSDSGQWAAPLLYTATTSAGRPVAPPLGSVVSQTDQNAAFVYGGSQWFRVNQDIGIPKYASAAARDVDNPSPVDGLHCYRTDLHQTFWYNGLLSQWLPVTQGTWTSYAPAWTTITGAHIPSIGNGVLNMRYTILGKTVTFAFRMQLGSTSNAGASGSSDNWTWSLPVAASSNFIIDSVSGHQIGTGAATPTTGGGLVPVNAVLATSSSFFAQVIGGPPSGASVNAGLLDESTPSTWATTGWVQISGSYEAA